MAFGLVSCLLVALSGCGDDGHTTARVMAKQYIESKLVSPDSAEWGSYDNMTEKNNNDGTWEVTGVVRAKNAFGVVLDTHYDVVEKAGDNDGNGWQLISIDMH
jgi:hypothetical protein